MAETLAQLVRAKFPGAYDDLSDQQLETQVLAKRPEYGDLPRTSEGASPAAPISPGLGSGILSGLVQGATKGAEVVGHAASQAVHHPLDTAIAVSAGKYISPEIMKLISRAAPYVGAGAGRAMNALEAIGSGVSGAAGSMAGAAQQGMSNLMPLVMTKEQANDLLRQMLRRSMSQDQ